MGRASNKKVTYQRMLYQGQQIGHSCLSVDDEKRDEDCEFKENRMGWTSVLKKGNQNVKIGDHGQRKDQRNIHLGLEKHGRTLPKRICQRQMTDSETRLSPPVLRTERVRLLSLEVYSEVCCVGQLPLEFARQNGWPHGRVFV